MTQTNPNAIVGATIAPMDASGDSFHIRVVANGGPYTDYDYDMDGNVYVDGYGWDIEVLLEHNFAGNIYEAEQALFAAFPFMKFVVAHSGLRRTVASNTRVYAEVQ